MFFDIRKDIRHSVRAALRGGSAGSTLDPHPFSDRVGIVHGGVSQFAHYVFTVTQMLAIQSLF